MTKQKTCCTNPLATSGSSAPSNSTDKKELCILLAFTPDLAFAAGALVHSLSLHLRNTEYQVVLLSDGLPQHDEQLLASFPNCGVRSYTPPDILLQQWSLDLYSAYSLSKFEIFKMLEEYRAVLWLDCDIAVQGDFSDILSYGPLAMALEDPEFTDDEKTSSVSINFFSPISGYDMDRPHYNSGVILVTDELPDPHRLYDWCLQKSAELGMNIKYPDQAIFNLLVQEFPQLMKELPVALYNTHPRNPASLSSHLVHGFGVYKFWTDGIISSSFPEWWRAYQVWLSKGGTPYAKEADNAEYLNRGTFSIVNNLYNLCVKMNDNVTALDKALTQEKILRQKLETLLARKDNPAS